MPCRSDDYGPSVAERIQEIKNQLDEATRVACTVIKLLRINNITIPQLAQEWAKEHDKVDQARKKGILKQIDELNKQIKKFQKELED